MCSWIRLSKALRPEYNIFAAGNGRDALIAAENNQPDVILLDIEMAELAEQIDYNFEGALKLIDSFGMNNQ